MIENNKNKIRLRPVLYTNNTFNRTSQSTSQQIFLLKALQVTQDPKKLKEMLGLKTVTEVYRELDKIAIRKEYHKALSKAGITFDYIVEGLKSIADTGEKDGDKLKAFQTLLKSVGLDKYDSDVTSTGTWEEILLKKIEEDKNANVISEVATPVKYEVKAPIIPESARIAREEEREMTSSIYDTDNQGPTNK